MVALLENCNIGSVEVGVPGTGQEVACGPEQGGLLAGAAGTLDLMKEETIIPVGQGEAVIVPVNSGGRWAVDGAMAARLWDRERLLALGRSMRLPMAISLTVDREAFQGPFESYRVVGKYLSKLLSRRLGFKVWCRVYEIQSETGEGWPHVHALVEAAGTRWDEGGFVPFAKVLAAVQKSWCHDWQIAKDNGVEVDLLWLKPGGGERWTRYMVTYITKPMEAWPDWILDAPGFSFRWLGMSKGASNYLASVGMKKQRASVEADKVDRSERPEFRRKRVRRSVRERLVDHQMTSGVLGSRGGWFGTLAAPHSELVMLAGQNQVPGLVLETRMWSKRLPDGRSVGSERLCVVLQSPSRDKVLRLNMALSRLGAVSRADELRRRRRDDLEGAWDRMQESRARAA